MLSFVLEVLTVLWWTSVLLFLAVFLTVEARRTIVDLRHAANCPCRALEREEAL